MWSNCNTDTAVTVLLVSVYCFITFFIIIITTFNKFHESVKLSMI
jgi:hypothetical protein